MTRQPFRLPSGGRIDRDKPVSFFFDGKRMTGFAGDTLASALLASGVHLVGRSFKYHRPRGIVSAGAEEPNALVTIARGKGRETPNLRATQVELFDGLIATSQNRWPSLRFDASAVNNLLSPLLPAGFYYKTFMWPASLWARLYEPMIRAAAGLGRAPSAADPDRYLHRYAHCDVLVVGMGPAGLAAAMAAAEAGRRVIVCDEQPEAGGSLLSDIETTIDGMPAQVWCELMLSKLRRHADVRLLTRTTAYGIFPDRFVGLAERVTDHLAEPDARLPRERLWQVRAKEIVLATGAIERPLVFPDNDRPGIMTLGAGLTHVQRYGVRPGHRAVIVGSHDSIYWTALALRAAGIEIAAVLDQRARSDSQLATKASMADIDIRTAATIVRTSGRLRVSGVLAASVDADGRISNHASLTCDHVLMTGGWTPNINLHAQVRAKLRFCDEHKAFLAEPVDGIHSAGACAGHGTLADAIAGGYEAGEQAARGSASPSMRRSAPAVLSAPLSTTGGSLGAMPHDRPPARVKAFVDFQNDVTAKDLKLAAREGFRSIEHVKRYTTTGMATDQGKTSNLNALAIVADAVQSTIPEVGLTTFRNPYTPVTFGTIAGASRGDMFEPVRHTPLHERAVDLGAQFEDVGTWKRAHYFPRSGESMHAAVARECAAVRTGVGMFDASTLGKIEVVGPDAGTFLDRIYTNAMANLAVSRCRYGLMLSEAGFVMDDGIVGRMAPDRFHVTTTTGGASRVLHHMEDYLQTEWPDLQCWLTSTTEQWAVIAVQGPRAREVLAPLIEGIDLGDASFPHMSVHEGRIRGVPCRLFRASFTGELGYEVNVPAADGPAIWDAIAAQGRRYGITPYGTETMHVLRAEKGFIIVGQETDGTVIPDDLGLDRLVSKKKVDFVGKRSLTRPDMLRPDRKQLVGLRTQDPRVLLEDGAQIVVNPNQPVPMTMIGHVTSAYWSECLQRSIAMALVSGGRARIGETLHIPMPERMIAVEVVDPVAYDPQGAKSHG